MDLTVLGASGATGRHLVEQALARGHDVVALVRDPASLATKSDHLRVMVADVRDPGSIRQAVTGSTVILSGLGVAKGDRGTLTAGARAAVAAAPARVIWLGAYGTGPSAGAAGPVTRNVLRLLGPELADKVEADATVLEAGGTLFHAGPLSHAPMAAHRRTVGLQQAPRRLLPAWVSRATVAAAMLDEAETPRFAGRVALPLPR